MYAKPFDVITRFTEREVGQVLGAEAPDLGDPRLIAACEDAAAIADDYLAEAYRLPLSQTPQSLVNYTAIIARYKLHDDQREGGDGGKSRVRLDYEDAIKWLERVAKGEVSLFSSEKGKAVDTSSAPHAVKASSRIAVVASPVAFTDKVLGKMRVIK